MNTSRAKLIQLIHIGKSKLGLDDELYRQMLHSVTGVESCSAMNLAQLEAVLKHLHSKGFEPTTKKTFGGRPHNADTDKRAELLKIEALLTDADKPWAYAEAMLKHMTKGRKVRMAFASNYELHAILVALHKAACKRLAGELEAEFGEYWEHDAAHYATLLFDKPFKHKLSSYPQPMSQVLRWWRGQLEAACKWPLALDKDSLQCCGGCHHRATQQALAR